MYVQRHIVNLTTDVAGDCTAYSPAISGLLSQIRYIKTDFANGVDFVITCETTGETLWSQTNVDASVTKAPRQAIHGTDGIALVFIAAGQPINDAIAICNDRVKIVIANGGATTTGAIHIVLI